MKFFSKKAICLLVALVGVFSTTSAQEVAVTSISDIKPVPTTNIRYIDMEIIMSKYTKAVEYQEWAILASDSAKNVLTAKFQEVQNFEAKCQKKLQGGKYKSDQAVRNDQAKLKKMAEEAQSLEQILTAQYQNENARRYQELQSEIMSYISEYNMTKGYDAILYKSAGVLFNPALDITKDILEGLNAKSAKVTEVVIPLPDGGLVPQKMEDNTITP